MAHSHTDVCKRWATLVGTDRAYHGRGGYIDGSRIFVADHLIYSYGRHFPMGQLIGDRRTGFVLLNGDRYSVTTAGHQRQLRQAVENVGLRYMIVPFTALRSAGIRPGTIRPLHIRPDEWETIPHRVSVPELAGKIAAAATGSYGWRDLDRPGHAVASGFHTWTGTDGAKYSVTVYRRGWDYGACAFVDHDPLDPEHQYAYREGSSLEHVGGNVWEYVTHRHWLGASVFLANVEGRRGRVKFISAFDENERRPLYFLAELPRCSARTYDEALDALAPRIVHAARAQGRDVKRQGDVFLIPTALTRADLRRRGASFTKRTADGVATVRLLGTDHTGSEVANVGGAQYARGVVRHDRREPDHARVRLGDVWHLAVRNTVPRQRQARSRSAA